MPLDNAVAILKNEKEFKCICAVSLFTGYLMQKADLEQMKLSELRNLLLGKMRNFIAALDNETSLQLEERKKRMDRIEEVMDKKSGRYPKKMTEKRS